MSFLDGRLCCIIPHWAPHPIQANPSKFLGFPNPEMATLQSKLAFKIVFWSRFIICAFLPQLGCSRFLLLAMVVENTISSFWHSLPDDGVSYNCCSFCELPKLGTITDKVLTYKALSPDPVKKWLHLTQILSQKIHLHLSDFTMEDISIIHIEQETQEMSWWWTDSGYGLNFLQWTFAEWCRLVSSKTPTYIWFWSVV